MQQHNQAAEPKHRQAQSRIKAFQSALKPAHVTGWGIIMLMLSMLACTFIQAASGSTTTYMALRTALPTLTRTPLPTLTPTVVQAGLATNTDPQAVAQAPAAAGNAPGIAAAGSVPAATPEIANNAAPAANAAAPTPTATSRPVDPGASFSPADWSFASLRLGPNPAEGGLLLLGEMINNSDTAQELQFVNGLFYNDQGQLIADEESIYDYWPVDVVGPGSRVPFGISVENLQSAANFNLSIEAKPSNESPREDFEFSDVNQWNDGEAYCLGGTLRNLGGALQDYLVVTAILYNQQDNMINFNYEYQDNFNQIMGDQFLEFEICVDPPNQDPARYELRAWGR